MDHPLTYQRYHRQIILKDFGEEAQLKLLGSRVLVIGAGGLGCPALIYLAGAGVGTIGLVDADLVSLSNLHRQVLYGVEDIGHPKVTRASMKLKALNPELNIIAFQQRLSSNNAIEIMSSFDLIIDGSDNFSTRYLVNDTAVILDKPVVYGAVSQYEGQVAVFNYHGQGYPAPVNYRDLFADPLQENEVLNCAEAGVLGVLPGIIGTMQASQAILLLTGLGRPLVNRLLTFNILDQEWYELAISPREGTRERIPADGEALRNTDYEFLCGVTCPDNEITVEQFDILISREGVLVIDVREPDEVPKMDLPGILQIPLGDLSDRAQDLKEPVIVAVCQSGKRSLVAAAQLTEKLGPERTIYSLKGGINAWSLSHLT